MKTSQELAEHASQATLRNRATQLSGLSTAVRSWFVIGTELGLDENEHALLSDASDLLQRMADYHKLAASLAHK